jgi:two-component system sensor histidine kinase KdpD
MANDTLTPNTERLLVCLGPGASSAGLINAARRMAADLKAKWYVLFVEDPKTMLLPEKARDRISDNLRLAEQRGAETLTLTGRHIAEEIITFAGQQNITKIVVGKPGGTFWKKSLSKSPVDRLVRMSGEMDVYVISGKSGEQRETTYTIRPQKIPLSDYGAGLLFFILASMLCFLMFPYFHLSNLIMVYLLGVMITAASCGRGPAVLGSFLSVLGFDFFFVPPRFSFTVEDAQSLPSSSCFWLLWSSVTWLTGCGNRPKLPGHRSGRQRLCMVSVANSPLPEEWRKFSRWPCNIFLKYLMASVWLWRQTVRVSLM